PFPTRRSSDLAAVAAVGPAERFELFAVDGGTAVPTVAGGQVDHRAVHEPGRHDFASFVHAKGLHKGTRGGTGRIPAPPLVRRFTRPSRRIRPRPGRC